MLITILSTAEVIDMAEPAKVPYSTLTVGLDLLGEVAWDQVVEWNGRLWRVWRVDGIRRLAEIVEIDRATGDVLRTYEPRGGDDGHG